MKNVLSPRRLCGPDFVKMAEAYGIPGLKVRRKEEVIPAIEKAMAYDGPFLIDFGIEPEENVYPFVPPGASLEEFLEIPKEGGSIMATTKHTLVALVEDKPGVLNRVASLFRRRGFNIDSITVGQSETPNISRMTIVVDGTNTSVEQVRKQLDKLIETVKVTDITGDNIVVRELALFKVKTTSANRSEVIQIVDIFRANIVDVSSDSLMVEVTGDEDKLKLLAEITGSLLGLKKCAGQGASR